MQNEASNATVIRRLVGVYNADRTLTGELAHFIGARLGRAHCALCDITHGLVRKRADWKSCRTRLLVPFETYHRNDQPDEVRAAYEVAPVVLADTGDTFVVLVGPAELAACEGKVERLVEAIERAVKERALSWST